MSGQHVAQATTYTTRIKRKRQTYLPSSGLEPAIPAAPAIGLRPFHHRNHYIEMLKIKDPKSVHREFFLTDLSTLAKSV